MVQFCTCISVTPCIYIYIYLYIYKKLSPKWKNFQEQKVFFFYFTYCVKNFCKIGPIIKKIPNFVNDPLNLRRDHQKINQI